MRLFPVGLQDNNSEVLAQVGHKKLKNEHHNKKKLDIRDMCEFH